MTGLTPYLHFAGTARQALNFYADVFGGSAQIHTFAEFGRSDGAPDAVAHGSLHDGPVLLFAADAGEGEPALKTEGVMFSLLGTSDPETLTAWFEKLSDGGRVVDPLQERPWNASDGQVIDKYGVHWLIGFQQGAQAA